MSDVPRILTTPRIIGSPLLLQPSSAGDQIFTAKGMQPVPEPRALTIEEVEQTVDDFRKAARRAIDAGADGVEIHGANGYLIQQFFAPNANFRSDAYGGSVENRARFATEVARAVAEEIGADRTGIRLSPGATLGGLDEGPEGPDLYRYLVSELNKLELAYVHIMHLGNDALLADIRALWDQALILNRPGRAREDIGSDVEVRAGRSGVLWPVRPVYARLCRTAESRCSDEQTRPRQLLRRRSRGLCRLPDVVRNRRCMMDTRQTRPQHQARPPSGRVRYRNPLSGTGA